MQTGNLYQDVPGWWRTLSPQTGVYRLRDCQWWDNDGLLSWPQVAVPLPVVRSLETWQLRSQLDGDKREQRSEGVWLTTLSSQQVPTARVVGLGHQRWDIANQGGNELVNGWHADHVYKHEPRAIEAFLWTAFLAGNLFHAFLARNLKPALGRGQPKVFWARVMAASSIKRRPAPTAQVLRPRAVRGLSPPTLSRSLLWQRPAGVSALLRFHARRGPAVSLRI